MRLPTVCRIICNATAIYGCLLTCDKGLLDLQKERRYKALPGVTRPTERPSSVVLMASEQTAGSTVGGGGSTIGGGGLTIGGFQIEGISVGGLVSLLPHSPRTHFFLSLCPSRVRGVIRNIIHCRLTCAKFVLGVGRLFVSRANLPHRRHA